MIVTISTAVEPDPSGSGETRTSWVGVYLGPGETQSQPGAAPADVRPPSGRRWPTSTGLLKKTLASLLVLGLLTSLTVHGASAIFTSEEHGTSTIASGTLELTDKVGAGTACDSNGSGSLVNVNTTCDAIVTYNAAAENYPGVPVTVPVQIKEIGSLDSTLSVYMPSCTAAVTGDAPAYAQGGANLCATGGAQFYLQETDSSGTPTKCWYPSGTTTCAFAADTLANFSGWSTASNALSLGSGPKALQTRYFVLGFQLAATADNTLQGEAAVFSLTWHMTS